MLREILIDTVAHLPPLAILDGMPLDRVAVPPGPGVHSAVAILAHLDFWQSWMLRRCEGHAIPVPASAADGWPEAAASDWETLRDRFAAGLARADELGRYGARLSAPVTPAIEFPPLGHFTVRDALFHIAQHNSHHLGQIVTTRQMLGCWPPPSGSWTW